jgi:hypothetical protein
MNDISADYRQTQKDTENVPEGDAKPAVGQNRHTETPGRSMCWAPTTEGDNSIFFRKNFDFFFQKKNGLV